MKIFVCVFQSLEDFQQCYPGGKPFTSNAFENYLKGIDSQIEQFAKQGNEGVKVFATAAEYSDWLSSADDYTRSLSQAEQMAAFAEFKGNQAP